MQGAHTSAVFTFLTPGITAVQLANGGTLKKVDSGDTATVTFNEPLNASTICSGWSGNTLSNATITFTNSGSNDTFAATSPTCSGNGNFGTVGTGSNYVTGTVTFTGSTITWDSTNDTLTFTLGTVTNGTKNNVATNVTAGKPGYTASGNVTDNAGIPLSTTAFTSGVTSGF